MNIANRKRNLKLGLMDFGFVLGGKTPSQAFRETFELARLADSLGFSRYWLPEHHDPHYAWAGPEILLPLLAERTRRIRVGAAAILLNLYRPLKVAENFRLISQLHPARVDLGICSGIPLAGEIERALVPKSTVGPSGALYGDKVGELIGLLDGNSDPLLWLMGTGRRNSALAAAHGTAMSYSLFHRASKQEPELIDLYRNQFTPSQAFKVPCSNIAVSIICDEDERRALRQKARVEELVKGDIRINIAGTPEQCLEQIDGVSERFRVDDLVLHSLWENYEDRARTCRILADLLDLEAGHDPPPGGHVAPFEPSVAPEINEYGKRPGIIARSDSALQA